MRGYIPLVGTDVLTDVEKSLLSFPGLSRESRTSALYTRIGGWYSLLKRANQIGLLPSAGITTKKNFSSLMTSREFSDKFSAEMMTEPEVEAKSVLLQEEDLISALPQFRRVRTLNSGVDAPPSPDFLAPETPSTVASSVSTVRVSNPLPQKDMWEDRLSKVLDKLISARYIFTLTGTVPVLANDGVTRILMDVATKKAVTGWTDEEIAKRTKPGDSSMYMEFHTTGPTTLSEAGLLNFVV